MRNLAFLFGLAAVSFSGAPAKTAPLQTRAENAPAVEVRTPYRVKQQGGGLGVLVDEAVVFHEIGAGPSRVWVVEHRRRDQKVGVVTFRYEWIDGRACPALDKVILEIGRIPPIAMAGPDTEPKGWVSDVPEVTLIGPPAGGRMGDLVVRRDLMGPVSRWWRASSQALETCWQAKMPYVAGAYDLRPKLATAADEVEIMRP